MKPRNRSALCRLAGCAHLLGAAAACLAALSGCEKGLHQMYDQAKYKPLTPTQLFGDGNSSRPQVPGSVPYSGGALAESSSGRNARLPAEAVSGASGANPLPISETLLKRGREQFDIFCAPCHSRAGDGDGMVARRGFPHAAELPHCAPARRTGQPFLCGNQRRLRCDVSLCRPHRAR